MQLFSLLFIPSSSKVDIDAATDKGITALHIAAEFSPPVALKVWLFIPLFFLFFDILFSRNVFALFHNAIPGKSRKLFFF